MVFNNCSHFSNTSLPDSAPSSSLPEQQNNQDVKRINPKKRSYEGTHYSDSSFGKQEEQSSTFLVLAPEIICQIFSNLEARDLLHFENAAKIHQALTPSVWDDYAKRERLHHLQYAESESEINQAYPFKWNYCLSKALIQYVKEGYPSLSSQSLQTAQTIERCFSGLMQRFSDFKAYVNEDLFRIDSSQKYDNQKIREKLFTDSNLGGDYLFGALSEARKLKEARDRLKESDPSIDEVKQNQLTQESFEEAIKKGGAYASLLAFYALGEQTSSPEKALSKRLIKTSALHDMEGLKYVLESDSTFADFICPAGLDFPRLLNGCMIEEMHSKKWQEADELGAKTIKAYGGHVPPEVWMNAGAIKFNLRKWQEADEMCIKAITAFGDNIPATLWADSGAVKKILGKWQEADEMYTKAIIAFGDWVPDYVWEVAGIIKMHLRKWQEADEMYTKAITSLGDNVLTDVWYKAGLIKMHLRKWQEADDYLTKAITSSGDNVPANVWTLASVVKMNLGKWQEADDYLTKAITILGDNASESIKANAALVKTKLKGLTACSGANFN